jgi:hypothetical protein
VAKHCAIEEVPRGLSRHPVVFVNYDGNLYALKELPAGVAEREYDGLRRMEELSLPAVKAVGHAEMQTADGQFSVVITRYLEASLPYRLLFMRTSLQQYRQYLLDAIAGLLVQLHLSGIFWGDCSLSNTLFRRDAGALRAYLVDAETTEIYSGYFSPTLRFHEDHGENIMPNYRPEFGWRTANFRARCADGRYRRLHPPALPTPVG